MKVCFLVSEVFAWGSYGGYGTITRGVAEALAARGHEVSALVPRRTPEAKQSQREVERLGGLTVYAIPHSYMGRIRHRRIYRLPDADVYVSVDPRFDSWLAQKMNPTAKHVIWFIDPMSFSEFWMSHVERSASPNWFLRAKAWLVFNGLRLFAWRAVQGANLLTSQREDLGPARRFPGVGDREIHDAPNTAEVPVGPIVKAVEPTVLFLGRFDRQKQPEAFFELAARLPDVRFIAAGAASSPSRDADLRREYMSLPNLKLTGVVVGEEKDALLRGAWILCNTSLREGLPRSFHEALAYECAIVSPNDPDGIVHRFGVVADGDLAQPISELVVSGKWRGLGQAGRSFVAERHNGPAVAEIHEDLYSSLIGDKPSQL